MIKKVNSQPKQNENSNFKMNNDEMKIIFSKQNENNIL